MAEVTGVSIEYLTPNEIRQLSVVQVTEANAFGHLQRTPLPGGLYDLKMGPVNRDDVCKTCGLRSECPGHCGHIELVSQVYNPFLVRRMLLLLKKMCTKCNHFRLKSEVTERLVQSFRLIAAGMESSESNVTLNFVDELTRANIEKDGSLTGSSVEKFTWLNASTAESWDEQCTKSKHDVEKVAKKLKSDFGSAQRRTNFNLGSEALKQCAKTGTSSTDCSHVSTSGEQQAVQSRIDSFMHAIPQQKCENCGTTPDSFRLDGYSKLFFKTRGSKQEMFVTPTLAKQYLARLFQAEPEILGFIFPGAKTQKEGIFFLENVVVPPNRFRPLRALGGASEGLSSSMYMPVCSMALKAILDANDAMKKELGFGRTGNDNSTYQRGAGSALVALQDAVNSYMDAAKNPKAANPDTIKVGVRQVLERKQGLFRMKMMGKRVNYAARSVISPDVSLETNHIGIPLFVAKELTVPEPVNSINAEYLRVLVENGPEIYPGAVSVVSDGRVVSLIGRSAEQRKTIANTLMVSHNTETVTGSTVVGGAATGNGAASGLSAIYNNKIVNRHVRNGDPLLVNRQPTLHKPGIMALLVRVLPSEKTIRMHYANCATFNADFDGDEINLHCPQDPVARAEALKVANADCQFLGPTAGQPLRGLIQDHVIGGTVLTSRDTFLAKSDAWQLLYSAMRAAIEPSKSQDSMLTAPGGKNLGEGPIKIREACSGKTNHSNIHPESNANVDIANLMGRLQLPHPAILKPRPMWTGKQLITAFISCLVRECSPAAVASASTMATLPGLYVDGKARTQGDLWGGKLDGNKEEEQILIKNSELLQGVLDKNSFGNANGGLIHAVYELLGARTAGLLITGMSRLFTLFLQSYGFTCAMGDLLVKEGEEEYRHKLLREAVIAGWAKLKTYCDEEGFSAETVAATHAFSEAAMILDSGLLGKSSTTDATEDHAEKLRVLSSQMGELIRREKGNKSSLVFGKIEGLMLANSSEYWGKCIDAILPKGQAVPFPENCFSAMVNTGAKGSKVNQSQICCLLGQQELEGHRVPLLSSMRTLPSFAPFDFSSRAGGFISDRFLSGIRPQEFFFHCMAGREGLIDTAVKTARSGYLQRCLVKHLECLTVNYDQTVRDSDQSIVQFAYGEDGIDVTKSSYLNKIKVLDANRTFLKKVDPKQANNFNQDIATAYEALRRKPRSERRLDDLLSAIKSGLKSKVLTEADAATIQESVDSGRFDPIQSLLTSGRFLGSVSEAHSARIHQYIKEANPEDAEELEHLLNLKFMRSLADAGEAVGTLAAQGMGEPSTQMTLNTFHLAGHGGANVTLGIPRLREIVQTASRKISTPSMVIPCSVADAKRLQNAMERVPLKEIVLSTHVSEKVEVDITGNKFRIYEVVVDLADLVDLNEVYPALTKQQVAKFLDHEFRSQLDREVKKLIRSSNANMEVKVQKAINDLTGTTNAAFARMTANGGNDDVDDANDRQDTAEPKNKKRKNGDDDDNDVQSEQSDVSDSDNDGGQYSDSSKSSESDSSSSDESSSDSSDDEDNAPKPGVKKADSEDDEAESSTDKPKSKKAKTTLAYAPTSEAAAVRAAIAVQKSTGDDVFCLPGQLYGNQFILKSRELRLTERVSKKILILEVVEDLCAHLYLQQTTGITRVIVGDKGLDTEGVNLDIFWAMSDIDHSKIRTNDIALMLDRYGVEACRLSIVNEISRVFGHYGISVDRRHLSLIADYMTHQGGYRPFNRAGMSSHASPFLKMTFETSVNFLSAACQDGFTDNLKSPAGALILGKVAPIGTGVFSLRNEHGVKVPARVKQPMIKREDQPMHFVFEESDDEDEDDGQSDSE